MRVAVFGGSGATGRLVIAKSLRRGWDVIAYVRDPSRLDVSDERLRVVVGELGDAKAISDAVDSCDAVISVLGPGFRTRRLVIARGVENVVQGMKEHGVRRLIVLATPSLPDPRDLFDPVFWLAVSLIRVLLPEARENIVVMGRVVADSGLDWTLVRIPLLSNAPMSSAPHVGWVGEPGVTFSRLPRETLAEFLVTQVSDESFICDAPVVSR